MRVQLVILTFKVFVFVLAKKRQDVIKTGTTVGADYVKPRSAECNSLISMKSNWLIGSPSVVTWAVELMKFCTYTGQQWYLACTSILERLE